MAEYSRRQASGSKKQQEDFIYLDEDFDQILAVIEADEEVKTVIEEAVEKVFLFLVFREVEKKTVPCEWCPKKCKSIGGHKIHMARKHPGLIGLYDTDEGDKEIVQTGKYKDYNLNKTRLINVLKSSIQKIQSNEVVTQSVKDELEKIDFVDNDSFNANIILSSESIQKLRKGKVEQFYSKFYADVVVKRETIFPNLWYAASTLLLSKLADNLVVDCKLFCDKDNGVEQLTDSDSFALSINEINALQYLAGYIIHKIYKKFKYGKVESLVQRDQVTAIMLACKGEESTKSTKLIDALNRGGLWCAKQEIEDIFVKVEQNFLTFKKTNKRMKNVIDIITIQSMEDMDVQNYYSTLVDETSCVIEKDVKKIALKCLIELYLKVRIHSYAKERTEKLKELVNDKKSLRNSLKQKDEL